MPGIGPKLQKAANDFNGFRDQVNRALAGIRNKDVNIYIHQQVLKTAGGQSVYSGAATSASPGCNCARTAARSCRATRYIVGEQGMELFVPKANGFVVPNDRLGASRPGSVALGGGPSITIQITQPLPPKRSLAPSGMHWRAVPAATDSGLPGAMPLFTGVTLWFEVRQRHLD